MRVGNRVFVSCSTPYEGDVDWLDLIAPFKRRWNAKVFASIVKNAMGPYASLLRTPQVP